MMGSSDGARWSVTTTVRDFEPGNPVPVRVQESAGNLVTTAGITRVWEALTGTAITAYSNANAHIGVGNGDTEPELTDTGLGGGSTAYAAMDQGFPTVDGNTVTFRATFPFSDANFHWREWSVRNAANEGSGTALNRKLDDFQVKSDAVRRTITVVIALLAPEAP